VELASLQTSFITLDEVIKTTNRRVNAIEHVIIPRIERTLAYIISELGIVNLNLALDLMNLFQMSLREKSSTG
jgi:H(+)-transporting ATP synthase subunit D